MHTEKTVFSLQNDKIAAQCLHISEMLSALRTDQSERIYIDLSLEELLLALRKHCGEQKEVTLTLSRYRTRCTICVDLPGAPCNVLKDSFKGRVYDELILPILDRQIVYSYSEGSNHYYLQIAVQPLISFSVSMLMALAAAILFGLAGRAFFAETVQAVLNSVFQSFSLITLGLIRMVAVPLVFCGMINGITGCGNLRRLNETGGGLLRRFLLSMLVILSLTFLLSTVVFPLTFSFSSGVVSVFQSILDTIVSFFPSNLVAPFLNGDGMQTVLLAVFAGVILLLAGGRSTHIAIGFRFIYDALMIALNLINRLIPFLIFALISNMILSSGFSEWMLLLRALGLEIVIVMLMISAEILLTARKLKRSIKEIIRTALPIFLKSFLTASAISAYPETEKALLNDFRLNKEDSTFGLSFATGIYGSANTINIPLVTIACAHMAGIQVSASWILLLAIQCYVYSLAIPSSTGGMLFVLSTVFTAFGIPAEYLAIGTPLLMIVDYPSSALRATATLLELGREYGKSAKTPPQKQEGN